MIALLPVDLAYAFDYMAILQVKLDWGLNVRDELDRVEAFLRIQCPDLDKIRASAEYHSLYKANHATYIAVDKAWKNEVDARFVQIANKARFTAKRRLQKRFWPDQSLSETKSQ
jgi:hypothetical protein